MCLVFVEKNALSEAQLSLVSARLGLPEHHDDLGLPQVWNTYQLGLFAFFEVESGNLVALAEASGIDNVQPGWWVDSSFRGKGYGKKVVDILAKYLKAQGVKRIGSIPIITHQQKYDGASKKLAQRLCSHFESECS